MPDIELLRRRVMYVVCHDPSFSVYDFDGDPIDLLHLECGHEIWVAESDLHIGENGTEADCGECRTEHPAADGT